MRGVSATRAIWLAELLRLYAMMDVIVWWLMLHEKHSFLVLVVHSILLRETSSTKAGSISPS